MTRWLYRFCGLVVTSEVELPEWAPFVCDEVGQGEAPDVRFQVRSPAPLTAEQTFVTEGKACRFAISEVAHFEVREGKSVVVTPAPGAHMREMRLFLLGSAWGILCYQRGLFALHASLVRVSGDDGAGCIAFCGASGAGKSSSLAWLLGRGFELWSDDLTVCDWDAALLPRVWPSTRRLKLWSESLRALGHDPDTLERDFLREDKFYLPIAPPRGLADAPPLPLRAIYVLGWGEAECVPLRGLEALRSFVEAATYRGTVLNDMGAAASYWEQCAHITRAVPVWRWRRPRDWNALPDAFAPILQHWQPATIDSDP